MASLSYIGSLYRALIVCNSVYEADPASFGELRGPRMDGPHLWRAIAHPPSGLFEDVDLLQERNSSAILEQAEAFFARAVRGDTVLFYFSGHGWTTGTRFYLCARNSKAALMDSTGVPDNNLNYMIDACKASEKIIVLDSCYGGALTKGEVALERLAGQGRYLLAAAPPTQKAKDAEGERQPSPFTKALVEGISEGVPDRGDGYIDLDGLFTYLDGALREGPRPYRKWSGTGRVAIARRRPVPPKKPQPAPPPVIAEPPSDLESPAPETGYSPERVRVFRENLRPDVAAGLPEGVTASELLHRLHLMNNGVLTVAGALLFGQSPTAVMPSAMVQCTRIDGTTKSATIARTTHLKGTIPEQITAARDFIAAHAQIGEVPTAYSARVEPLFKYPMVAVREIVANALVHRDYGHHSGCVHVRVFNDRIEVASPGAWTNRHLTAGRGYELSTFASESVRRNFRLADVVNHMRLVEGEGAGIPRAVSDCLQLGAPEPMVRLQDGFVVVTIFPILVAEASVSVEPPYGKLSGIAWDARAQLLAAITSSLNRARQPERRRVHVLTGAAGAGKTLVALEIARRAKKMRRLVFWIKADRLDSGMREVAVQLGASAAEVTQAWSGWASATDLVWRLLNDSAVPWLLIFDNVAEPRLLAGHGTGWLRVPATSKGVVIITTRDRDSDFWRDWATVHEAKPL